MFKVARMENTRKQQKKSNQSFPIPIWSGLFDHREKVGPAFWEFLWCVDRTTFERDGLGYVLGGKVLTSAEIAADIFGVEVAAKHSKTVERHLQRLARHKLIERRRCGNGCRIWVVNSKKWGVWGGKRDRTKSSLRRNPKGANSSHLNGRDRTKSSLRRDKNVLSEGSLPIYDSSKESSSKTTCADKPPVHERIKQFLVWWQKDSYPSIYEQEPTIAWGRDLKILRPLFEKYDDEAMRGAALAYLSEKNDFTEGHPLTKFAGSQFDRWRAKSRKTVLRARNEPKSKFDRLKVN